MVVAVVVTTVAVILVTAVLAAGVHLTTATVRESRWQLALRVAELGVEQAAAELNADASLGYTGTGAATPATVPGGQVATKVTAISNGYQIDAVGYVPSMTAANAIKRRLRVLYKPGPNFTYALFSSSGLFVKSTGGIYGDVYGKDAVEVYNGTEIYGDVISATSTVFLNQNAKVKKKVSDTGGGNIYSGGANTLSSWATKLDNGSLVEEHVHARVPTTASCASPTPYNLAMGGTARVKGKGYLPGTATGGNPDGGVTKTCVTAPPYIGFPQYHYDPSLYPSGVTTKTPGDFNALTSLSGVIRVPATSSDTISLACKTVTDDFVLVTEAKIVKPNTCSTTPFYGGSDPANDLIQIISLFPVSDPLNPAVDVENKLELPTPAPAMLLYSTGFCDLKNSVITTGAVYCNGLNIKNTLDITYDKRVRDIIGFGSALYVQSSFRELPSSTAL